MKRARTRLGSRYARDAGSGFWPWAKEHWFLTFLMGSTVAGGIASLLAGIGRGFRPETRETRVSPDGSVSTSTSALTSTPEQEIVTYERPRAPTLGDRLDIALQNPLMQPMAQTFENLEQLASVAPGGISGASRDPGIAVVRRRLARRARTAL